MSTGQVNILVVDDTPGTLAALASILEKLGENVVCAGSGREALSHLAAHDFAVALVDVEMPELDGFETAASIRRSPRGAHLPIIFLAGADPNQMHAARGYSLGAVDYIYAPLIPEVLTAKVRVFVDLNRQRLELEATHRRLQETHMQLMQAEKLASLGQLVAGLAHEINNPLAFVLGHLHTVDREAAHLAREGAAGTSESFRRRLDKMRSRLAEMKEGLDQIQQLVTDLRTFSRPDESKPKAVDVRQSVESAIRFLRHRMKGRIRVETRYDPGSKLTCHAGQLNQVLLNLLANAIDAIEAEGTITVTTGVKNGRFEISVRDTGCGIPESARHRIFEPFFTTKPQGRGTGLGLSIAYGIVQAHQGTIEVETGPTGTEFRVRLPLDPEEASQTDSSGPAAGGAEPASVPAGSPGSGSTSPAA